MTRESTSGGLSGDLEQVMLQKVPEFDLRLNAPILDAVGYRWGNLNPSLHNGSYRQLRCTAMTGRRGNTMRIWFSAYGKGGREMRQRGRKTM